MEIPIVYEDEFLTVVEKPPGVIVNRADTVKVETIQEWAEHKLKSKNEKFKINDTNSDFYNRAGIVHRLDKETSGLLLIAKTPQAFINLQTQFKERLVTKKYKTLVHGKVVPPHGEIRASVGRLPWNRERFGILPGGREAVTSYKALNIYQREGLSYSLLEVYPHTGRTHQIRIHLKYLGHPVVSDSFYAGRKTYRRDLKFCPRLFLHASYIKFVHPESEKMMELESNLPEDLQKVISEVSKNA